MRKKTAPILTTLLISQAMPIICSEYSTEEYKKNFSAYEEITTIDEESSFMDTSNKLNSLTNPFSLDPIYCSRHDILEEYLLSANGSSNANKKERKRFLDAIFSANFHTKELKHKEWYEKLQNNDG